MRAADPTFFVDPQDRRNIDDVVALGEYVFGVDQTRMSCLRGFDERTWVVTGLVERHRDRDETEVTEFFVECLPDRQIFAAASPGGVGNEENLLATMLREGVHLSVEIGQGEIRCLETC